MDPSTGSEVRKRLTLPLRSPKRHQKGFQESGLRVRDARDEGVLPVQQKQHEFILVYSRFPLRSFFRRIQRSPPPVLSSQFTLKREGRNERPRFFHQSLYQFLQYYLQEQDVEDNKNTESIGKDKRWWGWGEGRWC